jgi:hypothetical protein
LSSFLSDEIQKEFVITWHVRPDASPGQMFTLQEAGTEDGFLPGSPDDSTLLPSTLSFESLRMVSEVEPLRDSERSRTVTVLSSTPHFVLPFGPASH